MRKPCSCPGDWKEADFEILQNRMHSKTFHQEKLAEREIKVSLQQLPVALGPSCDGYLPSFSPLTVLASFDPQLSTSAVSSGSSPSTATGLRDHCRASFCDSKAQLR